MGEQGRIIINTGNGKGKTTAALGTAFRALGHGKKVCVIQFIKSEGEYGEKLLAQKIDGLDWYICGKGFVFNRKKLDDDRRIAREGFLLAKEKIESDAYDLVILDELTYLPYYGFLDAADIVDLLLEKPARLSVIITGRYADPALIEMADTVTEMSLVKHAYQDGIKAQQGIEF